MGSDIMQLIPAGVLSMVWGVTGFLLAREKGRNARLWMILGFIPVVNMVCIAFSIGAANLRHEQMLVDLTRRLSAADQT